MTGARLLWAGSIVAFAAVAIWARQGLETPVQLFGSGPPMERLRVADAIKGVVAVLATGLFVWGYRLHRRGCPQHHYRPRMIAFVGLGLVAGTLWWNLFQFHFDRHVHQWEFYHYYVGSKYFPELGYQRLYECTAVADAENGVPDVRSRKLRNLRNNTLESSHHVLDNPTLCKKHFRPNRWQTFRHDIQWFQTRSSTSQWARQQRDHGYNGTPTWSGIGGSLANLAPASTHTIGLLSLIDPALLILMWGAIYWAFGWQGMCLSLIWWGTNYPGRFFWNGGAFLRQDWLVATIFGICLVKKDKPVVGGVALAFATALRIFPGLILAAVGLKAVMHMRDEGRVCLLPTHQRLFAGVLAGLLLALGVSAFSGDPIRAWGEFTRNSQTHLDTPLTNNMGLKTVVAFDYSERATRLRNQTSSDPYARWKVVQRQTFRARWPLFALAVLAFVILLSRRIKRLDDSTVLILGVGLIPMATQLTCYYYSVFLAYGLLWQRGRNSLAIGLCATAALSQTVPLITGAWDEVYVWLSAATVAFAWLVTYRWPNWSRPPATG